LVTEEIKVCKGHWDKSNTRT